MATSIGQFLQLEKLDTNLFRNIHHRENFMGTLFGGQVLAQALMACTKTIDDPNLLPHSLHAYFLRAGKSADPVIYDVETVRDGQSIRSRRAVARQYGKPIFNMSASFHQLEEGYHHQESMPEGIASPEELLKTANPIVHDQHIPPSDNRAGAFNPLEILPLDGVSCDTTEVRAPRAMFWMRAKSGSLTRVLNITAHLRLRLTWGCWQQPCFPTIRRCSPVKSLPQASIMRCGSIHGNSGRTIGYCAQPTALGLATPAGSPTVASLPATAG